MRKAFQIFKRDLLRLLKNPVACVITIGVCIIPSLYAWYNIAANWDPYGSTAGVKIAVANEDEGTDNELTGPLNAGEQTMDQLKQNHDLGWMFTSAKEAEQGVRRGDYYAAIVIPKDFSKKLTSMLTGTFEEPQIAYYVNEKKNAIAPKVTDTGAETIEEQINETFVATVSETLVDEAKALGIKLDEQGVAVETGVLDQVKGASEDLGQIREALSGMDETIANTKTAVASAQATLGQVSGQVPTLTAALEQADGVMTTSRGAARDLATALATALTGGATQLGAASASANGAVGTVSGVVSEAKLKVDIGLSNIQAVIDANNDLIGLLDKMDQTGLITGAISDVVASLQAQNGAMQQVKDGLQAQSDAIGQDADAATAAMGAVNSAVQGSVKGLNDMQAQLNSTVLPQLSQGLDAFSGVSGDLSRVVAGVEPVAAQSAGVLGQLNGLLDQTAAALKTCDTMLADIQATLDRMATDVAALRGSASMDELAGVLNLDADEVADFMFSPVQLDTKAVYPVATYGSGVTPFYTNLALWVGGFVLIAIYKLEVDGEGVGAFTPAEGYFGRWLLMVALGLIQALVVCLGDLALGIQCGHPVLFVLAGLFISFVYVNVIYALALAFKHIGKALGVILVILQIPGSSGMYPIEMMPPFFQALHPLLPFTYGINAMRETIGGMYGMDYLVNLGVLALFAAVALFLGLWVRPRLLNLNVLFDRSLAATGMMICEKDGMPRPRLSLRALARALLDADEFRRSVLARGRRFEQRYPRRVKVGFALMAGAPVVLLAIVKIFGLGIEGKLVVLVAWVVLLVVTAAYLIALEYMRESLNERAHAASLSGSELRGQLSAALGEGPRASASTSVRASEQARHVAPVDDPKGGEA